MHEKEPTKRKVCLRERFPGLFTECAHQRPWGERCTWEQLRRGCCILCARPCSWCFTYANSSKYDSPDYLWEKELSRHLRRWGLSWAKVLPSPLFSSIRGCHRMQRSCGNKSREPEKHKYLHPPALAGPTPQESLTSPGLFFIIPILHGLKPLSSSLSRLTSGLLSIREIVFK